MDPDLWEIWDEFACSIQPGQLDIQSDPLSTTIASNVDAYPKW